MVGIGEFLDLEGSSGGSRGFGCSAIGVGGADGCSLTTSGVIFGMSSTSVWNGLVSSAKSSMVAVGLPPLTVTPVT